MIDRHAGAGGRAAGPIRDNGGQAGFFNPADPIADPFFVKSTPKSPASTRMTALERRASGSLAAIFAARMLGLFLVLPVFALEAARYPGGNDAARVGLAMGIYGLTQGILQIPFGIASDRFGRKRTIVIGLLIFAAGSFLAAAADTLTGLIIGRSLQGPEGASLQSIARSRPDLSP